MVPKMGYAARGGFNVCTKGYLFMGQVNPVGHTTPPRGPTPAGKASAGYATA
jgi:hypothetical protein